MTMRLTANGQPRTMKGFTLIELMVALGLFAVIMTIAAGVYLTMINANRHAQALAKGINNLSFALEVMTRAISTGSDYHQSGGSRNDFSFTDKDGNTVLYNACNGALCQTCTGAACQTPSGSAVSLTDPSVVIDPNKLIFSIVGALPLHAGDQEQARVQINIHGSVTAGSASTESFDIQTLATMRGSDI